VNQDGVSGRRGTSQAAHRQRVGAQRVERMILGGVDGVVRRTVDDDVRRNARHRGLDGTWIIDVEIRVREPNDLVVRAELVNDRSPKLPPGADDSDARHVSGTTAAGRALANSAIAPTTICCCSTASSP